MAGVRTLRTETLVVYLGNRIGRILSSPKPMQSAPTFAHAHLAKPNFSLTDSRLSGMFNTGFSQANRCRRGAVQVGKMPIPSLQNDPSAEADRFTMITDRARRLG